MRKFVTTLLVVSWTLVVYFALISALMYGYMLRDFNSVSPPRVTYVEVTVFILRTDEQDFKFLGAKRIHKDSAPNYYLFRIEQR